MVPMISSSRIEQPCKHVLSMKSINVIILLISTSLGTPKIGLKIKNGLKQNSWTNNINTYILLYKVIFVCSMFYATFSIDR